VSGHGDGRVHAVRAPRKEREETAVLGRVLGFPENPAAERDHGVGGEDRAVLGEGAGEGPSLRPGETPRERARILAPPRGLVDAGRGDREGNAEKREEIPPPRRGRSEDEAGRTTRHARW